MLRASENAAVAMALMAHEQRHHRPQQICRADSDFIGKLLGMGKEIDPISSDKLRHIAIFVWFGCGKFLGATSHRR